MEKKQNNLVHKGYHCAWQIHYHIVFPVKYRKALLDKEVIKIITDTAKEVEHRFPFEFEALGMESDHVHILCQAHPKVAPGKIVQIFKSITARQIFKLKPEVKKELWGGQFWTDGYYVGTVGEKANWYTMEQYVINQGKPKESLKQLTLF